MKLTFVGTGNAFTLPPKFGVTDLRKFNFQSNLLCEQDDRKLLLDFGGDIRFALYLLGIRLDQITDLFLSHLHNDHCGGGEGLAFSTYFNPNYVGKPKLFLNHALADELWQHVMRGGAGSLQGQLATLDTYFDVDRLPNNGSFLWQGVEFRLVQVVHYINGFDIVPSFGLLFRPCLGGPLVFWTSDTQFAPTLRKLYDMADLIFHDCETMYTPQRQPIRSMVHSHYCELVTLPPEIKAKTWLYHYNPGWKPNCEKDGFLGWVQRGQVFNWE